MATKAKATLPAAPKALYLRSVLSADNEHRHNVRFEVENITPAGFVRLKANARFEGYTKSLYRFNDGDQTYRNSARVRLFDTPDREQRVITPEEHDEEEKAARAAEQAAEDALSFSQWFASKVTPETGRFYDLKGLDERLQGNFEDKRIEALADVFTYFNAVASERNRFARRLGDIKNQVDDAFLDISRGAHGKEVLDQIIRRPHLGAEE